MSLHEPSTADVQAMQFLCAAARKPGRANVSGVLSHDWSGYPRVLTYLRPCLDDPTKTAVQLASRHFLMAAVEELEPLQEESGDVLSVSTLIEQRMLGGKKLDQIHAELGKEGVVIHKRTLLHRQNEAFRDLLDWARTPYPAAVASPGDKVVGVVEYSPARVAGSRPWPARYAAITGGVVVLGLVVLWAFTRPTADPPPLTPRQVGIEVRSYRASFLDAVWPEALLPDLGSPISRAMAIPWPDEQSRKYALVLGTNNRGPHPGEVVLWDPDQRQIIWRCNYRPPDEQILTHATIGDEALLERYAVCTLAYAGPSGHLDGRIGVVYRQRYSPTFVAFLDIPSGEVTGTYAHPGHLIVPLVEDLNSDGSTELILGGCDNPLGRPVVVVLDPHMTRTNAAASSVIWNERQSEDALRRFLLPDIDRIRELLGIERLRVIEINSNSSLGLRPNILIHVGSSLHAVYSVYVVDGAKPRLGLGDISLRLWQTLGLDADSLETALAAGLW